MKCLLCGQEVEVQDMDVHQKNYHEGELKSFKMCFGDILLRPGPGHIEMNMARALIKMIWHPYMQCLAILLGFRSPRAQDVIHNGVDHHRSRQILTTFFHSLSKELLKPYVQQYTNPTADHFMSWVESEEVSDPNYLFAWRVCFSYLLAFTLYTEGVRKNNHDHMMAARVVFAPLFFGRNHPRYRELHMRDLMDRVQCPPQLSKNIKENKSFTASGVVNKGQGADFLHEEVNKRVKSLLPPGAVTEDTWKRVCRNADKLEAMKCKGITSSGIKQTKQAAKRHDYEETMMRRELRQVCNCPQKPRPLQSLSNKEMDMICKTLHTH